MCHLRNIDYDAIGTVRENRTGKCPVKTVNSMKKEVRGSYDFRSKDKVLVIRWNDNAVVTIASNFGSVDEGRVPRWSHAEKKKIHVSRPTLFQTYNEGMGGVDQINQQVACYRTRFRQRKWWWPIFIYLVDVTVVNAWYLMRKVHGRTDSLLDFRRSTRSTHNAQNLWHTLASRPSTITTSIWCALRWQEPLDRERGHRTAMPAVHKENSIPLWKVRHWPACRLL